MQVWPAVYTIGVLSRSILLATAPISQLLGLLLPRLRAAPFSRKLLLPPKKLHDRGDASTLGMAPSQ